MASWRENKKPLDAADQIWPAHQIEHLLAMARFLTDAVGRQAGREAEAQLLCSLRRRRMRSRGGSGLTSLLVRPPAAGLRLYLRAHAK